jgi:hypothetical protein
MVRALTMTGLSLGVLLAVLPARAADDAAFGDKGQIILSADRVMGLFDYTSTKFTDQAGNTDSVNYTSFALLQNPSGVIYGSGGGNVPIVAPYNVPRLSIEGTPMPHLTVGGSLVVFFTPGASETAKSGGVSVSTDLTNVTLFGIAPRFGYILGLNRWLSIWPRGGFSFYSTHLSTPHIGPGMNGSDSSTYNELMINLEPMVVLTPAPHMGITAGPVVDIPLVGAVKNSSTEGGVTVSQPGFDMTLFHFGVEIGLVTWF